MFPQAATFRSGRLSALVKEYPGSPRFLPLQQPRQRGDGSRWERPIEAALFQFLAERLKDCAKLCRVAPFQREARRERDGVLNHR
ncbi:hypothetical protein MA20_08940 [Bradyrhizobium japonicum]|uniref:Uncharacterized protein n=1 Tax=Bradyrhizobium japonicum TaxID=375 RepID=A0A0A3Y0J1_BRAJP|nr:hypothetical protein MA20_08940 [Bradyrhizobium japonicum]